MSSTCNDCKVTLVTAENGEYVCPKCGVVYGFVQSKDPHWKDFGDQKESNVSGSPLDPIGRGSTTEIGFTYSDGFRKTKLWSRLKKIDSVKKINTSVERNIFKANIQLLRMREILQIPAPIADTAMDIYKKAARGKYLNGKTIYGTLCACVYAGYMMHDVPINLRSFSEQAGVDKTTIGKYYILMKENGFIEKKKSTTRVLLLISKIVAKNNFPGEVEHMSKNIYEIVKEKKQLVGKSPISIACAILYIVNICLSLHITQRELAYSCGVSEVSLRINANKFRELIDITVNV
jgi:transcription initiation factor TFIIB